MMRVRACASKPAASPSPARPKQRLLRAMRRLERLLPGDTGAERRAFCKRQLVRAVEAVDDKLPLVGLLADSEIVDALEKRLIEDIVERVLEEPEPEPEAE